MTRPVDPSVVRRLADCIELLPRYINNPQKMPFVQEVIQRALEQFNSDRETLARGHEALAQGDEVEGQLRKGKKYRYELGGEPLQAEKYREPVTSVWLSDTDKEALKDGFEEDETGIFEFFERLAADIGEWLKECRRPRDAELFRSRFSFVCGEALLYSQGVEVSPGVYKLDLGHWEAEVAKPLCDDLREFADVMATKSAKRTNKWKKLLEVNDEFTDKSDKEIVATYNSRFGNSPHWPKRATVKNLRNARSYRSSKSKSNHASDSGGGTE